MSEGKHINLSGNNQGKADLIAATLHVDAQENLRASGKKPPEHTELAAAMRRYLRGLQESLGDEIMRVVIEDVNYIPNGAGLYVQEISTRKLGVSYTTPLHIVYAVPGQRF